MDIIEKVIINNNYEDVKEIESQTWSDFEKNINGKKVIMFGVGKYANLYWRRYKSIPALSGVIDNDARKQGFQIGDLVPESFMEQGGEQVVSDISILEKYDSDNTVILITSKIYYKDIINELEKMGFYQYYVLPLMELNSCIEIKEQNNDLEVRKKEFVDICSLHPIKKNKIVFKSFGTYSDHGKYITEQLLKLKQNLDIVWILNKLDSEVPQGVRIVLISNWKKYIYEMMTAQIWVNNTVIQGYFKKRESQKYIHTKHWGSITLKKFYLDASTIIDIPKDVELWKYNGECIDYIITGSSFDEESCKRGFNFNKKFVRIGSPRTDAMFNGEVIKRKVYDRFNISCDKKVLLYAPTYRYKQQLDKHNPESRNIELNYGQVKSLLEMNFGGEWYIFLRLHPSVAEESKKFKLPRYVIDVSNYDDSEELCAASDILISDYSSIMFEPAFVGKPVFLFATDKKEYIDKEYDLLIDYDTLPFPIAESNEQLAKNIKNFNLESYQDRVAAFLKQYGVHEDGHASERAAEFILKLIEE